MAKLGNRFIDRMIENRISSKEIDFLLYIAPMQDESGTVYSVYYKDVCEKIDISIQTFYNILSSLEEKNLILVEKDNNTVDLRVTLLGNDFSDKDYSLGYFKVNEYEFQDKRFTELKAGSKLLYLYLKRCTSGRHGFVQTIYTEFCSLLQASKKTVQAWIHELKEKALLFVSLKRNKAYHYEICIKNSTVLKKKYIEPETLVTALNYKNYIFRNFKKNIPINTKNDVIDDIVGMTNSNRARKQKGFFKLIITAIQDSFDYQRYQGNKKPLLNAGLVNDKLTKRLSYNMI